MLVKTAAIMQNIFKNLVSSRENKKIFGRYEIQVDW